MFFTRNIKFPGADEDVIFCQICVFVPRKEKRMRGQSRCAQDRVDGYCDVPHSWLWVPERKFANTVSKI